jgi:hypothetical protein
MIFRLYNWLDKFNIYHLEASRTRKVIIFLLSPILVLLEYICYNYFWKKIILTELIVQDHIFEYINAQEFGLNKSRTKLYKKDLLDDIPFYRDKNNAEIKKALIGEYSLTISNLIAKTSSINIENYISIEIIVEDKISRINGSNYSNKVFSVSLQFVRYWFLINVFKKSLIMILLLITVILFLFITYI